MQAGKRFSEPGELWGVSRCTSHAKRRLPAAEEEKKPHLLRAGSNRGRRKEGARGARSGARESTAQCLVCMPVRVYVSVRALASECINARVTCALRVYMSVRALASECIKSWSVCVLADVFSKAWAHVSVCACRLNVKSMSRCQCVCLQV